MIHRTYVVQMPEDTTPIDIVVMGYPGSAAAPIKTGNAPVGWSGNDGVYYEWRGRPLRLPVLASAGAAGGFVPRFRLGFMVSVVPISSAIVANVPGVRLSQTLASLSSTDTGPSLNIPVLADPSYGPVIRLTGSAAIGATPFLVHLQVMDVRDEDRDPAGI